MTSLREKADDGTRVRKATGSPGRGMLIDDPSQAKREEMAAEIEAEIRAKRRNKWQP